VADESSLAAAASRRLPPDAVAGLREAFAGEVAQRLPRLREAVTRADAPALQTALRDAHSLGSSAVVVGEPEVSRCAREAERLLLEHAAGADVLDRVRLQVEELGLRLASWSP
jgi:HPt (histidine-containing phosphotransfer) domain-containing protein